MDVSSGVESAATSWSGPLVDRTVDDSSPPHAPRPPLPPDLTRPPLGVPDGTTTVADPGADYLRRGPGVPTRVLTLPEGVME